MKSKKKNLIYAATFVCAVILLSGLIPSLSKLTLQTLRYPLGLCTLIKRELGGIIFYHRNLVQNERLKRKIDLLTNKLDSLNEIYLENERLKNLLSFKQKSSYKVIVARVIGRSADSWSSIVLLDKGSNSGIKTGFAAITPLGLAGRVIETAGSTSKVVLINDPSFSVSAIVQRSRQEGLVSGTLGQSLMMRYLAKDSDIQVSDLIITSGLTGNYPKGIFIGKVVN
ncbi:MAG: rod shape-determining protein MreC, partial [Omnitrophica WOR_2 bacterium RBG_13_44_8]